MAITNTQQVSEEHDPDDEPQNKSATRKWRTIYQAQALALKEKALSQFAEGSTARRDHLSAALMLQLVAKEAKEFTLEGKVRATDAKYSTGF